MSIVKKIILVIIILLFSIILYRLFENRRTIQKNMENNVMTGVKHVDPRPNTLRTAVGGSRLQASLADPNGCLDGSERFIIYDILMICIK